MKSTSTSRNFNQATTFIIGVVGLLFSTTVSTGAAVIPGSGINGVLNWQNPTTITIINESSQVIGLVGQVNGIIHADEDPELELVGLGPLELIANPRQEVFTKPELHEITFRFSNGPDLQIDWLSLWLNEYYFGGTFLERVPLASDFRHLGLLPRC